MIGIYILIGRNKCVLLLLILSIDINLDTVLEPFSLREREREQESGIIESQMGIFFNAEKRRKAQVMCN